MNLSSDLISQFVKVTNDKTEPKKESTVYGTAVEYDGAMYVKIDGSELLTPVETTTDMKDGERVTVTIKNHAATVTGNISSPAARTDTVKEVDGKVEKVSSQISDFEIIVADKVNTEELNAEKARINTLVADNITINDALKANEAYISKVEAETVTINGKLEASEAEIEKIKTEKLDVTSANAKYATIENLEATDAEIYNLKGTYAEFADLTTDRLEATEADIDKLNTDKLSVADADIKYADIDDLDATNANITNLSGEFGTFKDLTAENFSAVNADIEDLETKKLSAESADLKYANIDFTNIGKATMQYFYAQSGLIKDVVVGDQTITGHLVGVTISGDLIEGNTIKAEKLVIKGSDGLYYQLNTDGMVTEAEQTDENSLNGSIIRAKSITASKISVTDLVAFGATIGGFHITDNSIYSGVKETVGNTTRGIYLDNDGQVAFGDSANFVKFYKDTSGNYKLAIAADELVIGSSGTSVETVVINAQAAAESANTAAANAQSAAETAQNKIDNLKVGGRNLMLDSRLTRIHSNNSSLYPIEESLLTDGTRSYYRVKRTSTTSYPTTFSIYNNLAKSVLTENLSGEEVTFSVSVRCSHSAPMMMMHYVEIDGVYTYFPSHNGRVRVSTTWQRIAFTATIPAYDDSSSVTFRFLPFNLTDIPEDGIDNFYLDLCEWKIEKGNRATDWTPAPEDIEAEVASIETRVLNAETQITKNNEAIELRATKTEVTEAKNAAIADTDNKLKNYSTTAQMNSALTVKANEITSHVSATYTTKEDFENLEVGGRNLLLGTSNTWKGVYVSTYYGTIARLSISELAEKYRLVDGDLLTYSLCVKSANQKSLGIRWQKYNSDSDRHGSTSGGVVKGSEGWMSIVIPFDTSYQYLDLLLNNNTATTVTAGTTEYYKCLKLEKGNKATDWTPAPEDVDARIESAETRITQTEKDIQLRATTEEMNAAIKVAADGISSEVSSAKNDIESLKKKVPWVTDVWVDATAYDESLWIPFTGTGLHNEYSSRISVSVTLNGASHPSWATHPSGFTVEFEVEDTAAGWGATYRNPRIFIDTAKWCDASPVSYAQLSYSSTPILYLRGGGKYRVRTSYESTWTGYPDGYTWTSGDYSQSAPTYTSRPAPEGDSYAWQADMTEAKSKLDQQAGQITAVVAKANQNETDIASLKLTNNAFEVRFGTVESDVDTAIEKATKAQENLDNLELGGRNYLTNAKRLNNWSLLRGTAGTCNRNHAECPNGVYLVAANSSHDTCYRLSDVITSNGYWTVSFEIKGSQSATVGFDLDICGLGQTRILTNNKNTWEKRSLTVNVTNYSSDVYHFVGFENIYWAYIFVRNIKIEKGAIATDWTPAPEDVDSAISTAQSTANTAKSNAAAAQTTANSATTAASKAQSDATAALEDAATAQSTADGVKTDLANNYTKKTIPDTRNDNQNPQWYMTNYPKQIITEFKSTSVIGLSGETYCALTTTVPWGDASGGYPKQVAKVGNKEYWRVGTSATAWGNWNNPAAIAENYMTFRSVSAYGADNAGLIVGNILEDGTEGPNVRIGTCSSDGEPGSFDPCIDMRHGDTVLARYTDDTIFLGINSPSSVIDLCSGTGKITSSALSNADDWWQLLISSQNSIGLESGGNIILNTDYSNGANESHTTFSMGSDLPFGDDVLCYGIWSVSGTSGHDQYSSAIDLYWSSASIGHVGPYGISQIRLDDDNIILDALSTTSGAVQVSGRLDVTGAMKFTTNNSRIWGVETNGTEVEVFQAKNSSNNTVIGWGNYNQSSGNTNVYGNNVMIRSKNDITIYADGGNAILRSDSESPDGYSKVYGPEVYIHPVNTHTSFRPYYHGIDSFTTIFRGAGYVTSSGKSVYFAIPLAKPIIGSPTVTVTTTNGFVLRQNNSYTHGSAYASSGYTYAKPTSYNASIDGSGSYILVNATFSVNTNATNNSPIGIDWTGKVTFAYG